MKKLMTIFGAFFFASVVLTSCGDANIEDLDKDIESEEDVVEAMLTLGKAQLNLMESLKGPLEEMVDLQKRYEDINDASEDIRKKVNDEEWDYEDLEDADNWDEYEDMLDEIEDLGEEIEDLMEDCYDLLRLSGGGRDDVYDDYDRGPRRGYGDASDRGSRAYESSARESAASGK